MSENKIKLKTIRIGFMGDSAVGKTAIIESILGLEFNLDMLTTYSERYETKFKLKNNEDIRLIILDNGGQERFRSGAFSFMKSVHGIILTFDFTKRKSFDNLNEWLEGIKENITNPFIVLFGNKVDMDNYNLEITSEEASKFAKEKGIAYFETFAKTGQGINEGLSYLVNKIYDKLMEYDDKKIDLNNIKPNNNKSNCAGNKKSKSNKK